MIWIQKNKYYNAKKTKIGDSVYDSKFEGGIAQEYILEKAGGKIKDFKAQITLDLICNGYKIGKYRIDFVVYENDGIVNLVEAKGLPSQIWKYKWAILETMVETRHPYLIDKFGDVEMKMLVIKQGSNWKLRKPKKYGG